MLEPSFVEPMLAELATEAATEGEAVLREHGYLRWTHYKYITPFVEAAEGARIIEREVRDLNSALAKLRDHAVHQLRP